MNIHKTVLHRYYPIFSLLIIVLAASIIYIGSFEAVLADEALHRQEFAKLDVYKDFPGVELFLTGDYDNPAQAADVQRFTAGTLREGRNSSQIFNSFLLLGSNITVTS